MAIIYGLSPTGLAIKSLSIIRADLESAVRGALGISLILGDSSCLGIILGILAERYAELWALMQAVYASQDPDSATGMSLDQICKLTGTLRPGASSSTVLETFTGISLTDVPQGTIIQTVSTSQPFATTADATTAALSAWTMTTPYVISNRVTANGNCYQCSGSGVSASGGSGPAGTDFFAPITDNTATWIFLGVGVAAVDIQMLALNTGNITAVAGDLSLGGLQTPIPGISGCVNTLDALAGAPAYTDAQLRSLREQELAGDGAGTAQAIQAKLDQLVGQEGTDVLSAKVYNNTADTTDPVKGIPPHAIMALVQYATPPPGSDPAADAAVSGVIYSQVVAGIATAGSSSATFTDSQGLSHVVFWQVASPLASYVRVVLEYDPTLYPADGDVEVKAAIASITLNIGQSLFASKVVPAIFGVPGVLNVYPVLIWGTSTVVDPIGVPVAWATSTSYSATAGARSVVTTASGRSYICVTSGNSASSGTGPSGTGTSITDGTAAWAFLQNPVNTTFSSYCLLDTAWVAVSSSALS